MRQKVRQKIGQNCARASERRTGERGERGKHPANVHELPRDEARPRGFEPLTFGSVDRCSTSVPTDARGPRDKRDLIGPTAGRLSAIPRASERSRRGAPDNPAAVPRMQHSRAAVLPPREPSTPARSAAFTPCESEGLRGLCCRDLTPCRGRAYASSSRRCATATEAKGNVKMVLGRAECSPRCGGADRGCALEPPDPR